MTTLGLRTRFTLAMLAWVLAGLLAVGISTSALFKAHVEQLFDAELEEHLVELMGLTEMDASGHPRLTRPLSDPRYGASRSGYYWQISRSGGLSLRSPSMGDARLDQRLAHSEGISILRAPGPAGEAMVYGMTRPAADGATLHYMVATDVGNLDTVVRSFQRDLMLWLGGLAAVLLAGAALALRFATRPLDRLGAAIAEVRAGTAQRMGAAWPSEIAPLAEDLDRLIDSREAMVAAARIEAGNLAHGLRTSLAVLTDEAESLADQPASATLLAECRRMARQLDWHLAQARAAAGSGAVQQAKLADVLAPLLSAMRRLHQSRDVHFEADGPELALAIDPDALAETLSNLLDNAGKWASAEVLVRWAAPRPDGEVVIEIIDDGPGIAEAKLRRLFVPGVRLDEQVPGHGLGLAIARDLVEKAGGGLELTARADGRPGTTARLRLKAASAPAAQP